MEFDENNLLPDLFGVHNANLARIERALDVVLSPRGNQLNLEGPENAVQMTSVVLNSLYDLLQKGRSVDMAEVEAALRIADQAERTNGDSRDELAHAAAIVVRTHKRHISPRSATQAAYMKAIDENDLVFGTGPAGTGKTYLAVAKAVERLMSGQVARIILSRPAVEAGEQLGFLPGDMREKVDPYLRPLYDALYDMMPAEQVVRRLENGEIEVAPLAFMRGRTLANAFVILDEAQNTTAVQMKMFLTRLGDGSSMVITGDLSQVDLPSGVRSGLRDALDTLGGVEGVAALPFTEADVVRHALVARIVRAYDDVDRRRKTGARYEHVPEDRE
ncbi:MAG: PhoH family protein [Rhodospirillales bacterium]|nr:PhoH family protein [Rhodospirillales bacterium]MCW8862085.1 PhoH family protein [Rhodospirillales bacterium]MCW8951672.1 PhoH family protein [Rhodospirillales bacterium]MCW9040753.1 PhoH family protein [Rhodospirillales bacterium]